MGMLLHCGARQVTLAQVKATATPEFDPEGRWHPIPHALLVEETKSALKRVGFEIKKQEYALHRDGQRFFGCFTVVRDDIASNDRIMAVGVRNSHDKSLPAALCIGDSVFVCDNLAFSSDERIFRRHTKNILNDLPHRLTQCVSRIVAHFQDGERRIEAYKAAPLTIKDAAHTVFELVDGGSLPKQKMFDVLKEFQAPRHEEFEGEHVFNLWNAFTEHMKGSNLGEYPKRSMAAQGILDKIASHVPVIEAEVIVDEAPEQVEVTA